jgi:hypothetical protein
MKKVLLVLTLSLLTIFAQARKFYISSSTGNDNRTYLQAQNSTTPWQTLKNITYFGSGLGQFTTYPNKAAAGDTFLLKRGDTFANGETYYSSVFWLNYTPDGYSCPSGTATNPIVFTNYGDVNLPLPNLLYPTSTIATNSSRNVFELGGVTNIIIDGLQFNENRGTFSIQDKANPAPTRAAIWLGTNVGGTWQDTTILARKVKDCIVRNCYFNNVTYAIGSLAGIRCEIYNNVITNLKSGIDTSGTYDIGAGAFEGLNGYYNKIHHNYVKGVWAKSGRVSSTWGLFGVGCDVFNLKYSSICYNTFIDCSGMWEIGNIDRVDPNAGAQYDTFAYNKVINCGQLGYIHGAINDPFIGKVKSIYNWNNVVINNNKSRISGPNFGYDMYGDGQSFRGNSSGQYSWWFFRGTLKCPNAFNQDGDVTNGSSVITIPTTGIQVNSRIYTPTEILDGFPYKTVISIGSGTVTVDAPFTTTGTIGFTIFPPLADQTWSQPINPPYCNWGGHRLAVQYSTDAFSGNPDTIVDLRNNIFYATTGDQMIYDVTRTKQKHSYNIYYVKGSFLNPTSLGGTLGTGEYQTTTKLFVDTSSAFPEDWDLHLAIGKGTSISGLTKDFAGVKLSGVPDVGLYKYSATPLLVLNSSADVSCKTGNNGSFTISASGGTAPYTYKVNNSLYTTTTTYSNLAPATYTVTVKDSKGLLTTINVTIKSSNITCP